MNIWQKEDYGSVTIITVTDEIMDMNSNYGSGHNHYGSI